MYFCRSDMKPPPGTSNSRSPSSLPVLPLPPLPRLPPRSVALVRQPALARRFPFRRVRHRMVVIAFGRVVCSLSPLLKSPLRRMGRDQRVAAAADQVGAAGLLQRLAHLKVI